MARAHNNLINSGTKIEIIKTIRIKELNIYKLANELNKAYSTIWEHVLWLRTNNLIRITNNGLLKNNEKEIKDYILNSTEYLNIIKNYETKKKRLENIYI